MRPRPRQEQGCASAGPQSGSTSVKSDTGDLLWGSALAQPRELRSRPRAAAGPASEAGPGVVEQASGRELQVKGGWKPLGGAEAQATLDRKSVV